MAKVDKTSARSSAHCSTVLTYAFRSTRSSVARVHSDHSGPAATASDMPTATIAAVAATIVGGSAPFGDGSSRTGSGFSASSGERQNATFQIRATAYKVSNDVSAPAATTV